MESVRTLVEQVDPPLHCMSTEIAHERCGYDTNTKGEKQSLILGPVEACFQNDLKQTRHCRINIC